MQSYEQLLAALKQEGSYEQYLSYLQQMYGAQEAGSQYGFNIDRCKVQLDKEFLKFALSKDLDKKSLPIVGWIAEAERAFKPYSLANSSGQVLSPQSWSV